MDNLIYIGYRIDCNIKDDMWEEEDNLDGLEEQGFSINHLPGEDWMFWPHVNGKVISVFPMIGEFAGDYRCPIDREEIYRDLFKSSIDVPEGFVETIGKIMETKLFKELNSRYETKVTWGLFLGLD